MTSVYINSLSNFFSTNQKMTKTIQELRDWANFCVQRGLAEQQEQQEKRIAISTPTVYNIPSSTNRNRVYSIRDLGTLWTCDCPAMQFYSNRGYCKHIKQVQNNA